MKLKLVLLSDRLVLGFLVGCMITFPLSVWLTRRLDAPKGMAAALAQDVFNYSRSLQPTRGYEFPKYGEKIDLNNLKGLTADGVERTLAEMLNGKPAILVAVDPNCYFCSIATDQMRFVHEQTAPKGISYCIVALGPMEANALSKYRDKLGPDIPFFMWSREKPLPRKSLLEIPTPTHLLVDGGGTILRIWPGSSRESAARSRMGTQIVSDTFAVIEAMDALKRPSEKD